MQISKDLLTGIAQIEKRIAARIGDHADEVTATLAAVADGELEIVETISEDEKALVRQIFGVIAKSDIAAQWAKLQPILDAALADPAAVYHQLAAAAHPPPGTKKLTTGSPLLDMAGQFAAGGLTPDKIKELEHLAVLLVSYILYDDFHYPQPETGVYAIATDLFEKLKWAYRYWFNQLEVAQKGSGLEEFFASQVLDLPEIPATGDVRSTERVTVTCAGDLLAVDVLVPENTPELFDGIADFFTSADIVSANLESTVDVTNPVGRTQAPGEPARMNTSQAMFDKFRNEAKINFFPTATNHALDWGESGAKATLDVLAASGARYTGTAADQAGQDEVVIFEKGDLKIGLLSFTFDLNGHPRPSDKPYLANEVRFNDAEPGPDYELVERLVGRARDKGADWIIAWCHWGWEFEMYPHPNVVEAANQIVARGVDVILGNHPHVSQPGQIIERGGPDDPDALVTYAFGDFVSYHPESRNSKLAYAIKFDVVKVVTDTETVTYTTNVRSLPIYLVNALRDDGTYDCRIVPFDDVLADPDGFGLTDREKSELDHLDRVVWQKILSPISRLPRS